MTKEELKKETEEYAEGMAKYYASTHEDYIPSQFEKYLRNAYISSAEPREKKIKELEDRLTEAVMNAGRFILRISEKEEEIARLENQLTKAKEIIKEILHALNNDYSDLTWPLENNHPALEKARQFLKEIREND